MWRYHACTLGGLWTLLYSEHSIVHAIFAPALVWQWWNGELERRSILYQARTLHDAHMTHQQAPTYPVPAYLKARVKAGLALPRVEVVERETDGTGSEREGEGEGQQERHAVLKFVVGQLSEELFTELIQGFHARNSD